MKNILCFLGSPRLNGTTKALLDEIKLRLDSSINFEIINLVDYKINGCNGCNLCQSNIQDFHCVQNDDGNMLLDKIVSADAIIYATPLYGHNYSGQMKMFLDRHVSLFKFVADLDKSVDEMQIVSFIENKPMILLVTCQGPEENNTELIQQLFDKFCQSSLSRPYGKYIFPFSGMVKLNDELYQNKIDKIISDLKSI